MVDLENSSKYPHLKSIYLGLDKIEDITMFISDAQITDQPDEKKEELKAETEKKTICKAHEFYTHKKWWEIKKRFSFDDEIYKVISFAQP